VKIRIDPGIAAGDIETLAVEAEMACPTGAISLEEE
jgi:hypothetical protein